MEARQRPGTFCANSEDKVYLKIRLQPRASKNEICGIQGGLLKLKVTEPPIGGKANEACCEFLAKVLGLPKKQLSVWRGLKSRDKIMGIEGIDEKTLAEKLSARTTCGRQK